MNITFACGRCAHQFTVSAEQGTPAVACPQCGFRTCYRVGGLAPAPEQPTTAASPAPSSAVPRNTPHEVEPEAAPIQQRNEPGGQTSELLASAGETVGRQRPGIVSAAPNRNLDREQFANRKRSLRGAAIAGGALFGLTLVGWGVYQQWWSPSPDSHLVSSEPVAAERQPEVAIPEEPTSTAPPAAGSSAAELPTPDTDASVSTPPASTPTPSDRIAHSLEQARFAIVEFVMPMGIGNLNQYGTGFLIDSRGWVATNNHVIARATTAARVELVDGRKLELAGIVARAPQWDLAIVKLKTVPDDMTLLDINHQGNPPLGEEVYAFGHPYNAAFSLSKGIVSRVLTTEQWSQQSPRRPQAQAQFPADMIWIQHDAKLSPGNSGGPLLDAEGHVFGVNSFVHVKAEFGYASHVQYLRDLMSTLSGQSEQVEPLPAPAEAIQTQVSSQKIASLFQAANQQQWQPQTPEQYSELAELAQQMTLAKHASLAPGSAGPSQLAVIGRVAEVADRKFAELQKLTWNSSQLHSLAPFVEGTLDNPGGGVFAYGVVVSALPDQQMVVLQISDSGDLIVLRGAPALLQLPRRSPCLILGFVLPQHIKVRDENQGVERQVPLVLTYYSLPLRAQQPPPTSTSPNKN